MNNPRLQGVVNIFGDRYSIEEESIKYEYFTNYLFVKNIYHDINKEYPFESEMDINLLSGVNFGRDATMALDGCFIIHDKTILHLNLDDDDFDSQFFSIEKGDIHIVLIQTKTGKFETTDVSTLANCLDTEFKSQDQWAKFVNLREKCNQILQKNPIVNIVPHVLYVSGNAIDPNLFSNSTFLVREDALKLALKRYFWIRNTSEIDIKYYDANSIYGEYENQESASKLVSKLINYVEMSDQVDCGDYGAISFGIITTGELMKIIYNDTLDKENELYGYNVRDAIEGSPINSKIEESLRENKDKFLLLNNGITLIVDKEERRGRKGVFLENVRIVNGCQTSHSIINVCKNTTEFNDVKVSVRIIEIQPEKDEIYGEITYSSNNQNPVKKSNLFAIESKVFKLEQAYKDFFITNYHSSNLDKVLLERRQGQFNNSTESYIDMLAQAKAYTSLWDMEPHKAVMYAEANLDKYKTYLPDNGFINKSAFSGILWHNIIKGIPSNYYNARFHIFGCIACDILRELYDKEDIDKESLINVGEESETLLSRLGQADLKISEKINKVCQAIDSLSELFPKLSSGKIHYRKFYPVNVFSEIWAKYKTI